MSSMAILHIKNFHMNQQLNVHVQRNSSTTGLPRQVELPRSFRRVLYVGSLKRLKHIAHRECLETPLMTRTSTSLVPRCSTHSRGKGCLANIEHFPWSYDILEVAKVRNL